MIFIHIAISLVCICLSLTAATTAKPPHILFIVADDLGFNDLSLHGSPQIPTPNIDSLALDGGVDLLNYHAQPVCSPSRSEFMSGRHVITTGIYFPFGQGTPDHLRTDVTLLPEYLERCCNYSSHMVGKWHLGQGNLAQLPTSRGFESYLGYWTGAEDHVTHETTGAYDFSENELPATSFKGNWSTQIFSDRASEIINEFDAENSSLFLYLAFQDVHWPLQAPPEYFEAFNGKVGNETGSLERQWVCAMASFLDDGVGKVVQALKNKGMFDDTFIIFVADNGGPTNLNEGTNSNNFPMRGGKNTLWEGGTRVNGIIRGPGISPSLISAGSTNIKIHATDWLPTLVKMSSGRNFSSFVSPNEPPYLPVDGQDIWQVIETGDESISPRDWLLLETHPLGASQRSHGDALIVGDMKILKWQDSPQEENLWHPPPGQDPMSVKYTFNCRPPGSLPPLNQCNGGADGKSWCLFNVTADPCETNDLSSVRPEIVSSLVARLETYMQFAVPQLESSGPQPLRMINNDSQQTVVWTTVDGPCLSDVHCNLNGICNSDGTCSCKEGWRGSKCGVLDLLQIDPSEGMNQLINEQSSWGGSAVYAEEDGLYHLFYSKILGKGCGLNSWITNSACYHATSSSPQGPFANESMVFSAFCHNAIIRRAADKTFLLYHIGDGLEPGGVKNCTSGKTSDETISSGGSVGYNTLAYSMSVWGPWNQLGYSILNGSETNTDHWYWQSTVTNLAPWPRPDGSVLTVFRGKSDSRVEQLGIASAPHWRGPYTRLSNLTLLDGSVSVGNYTGEDPFLWVDEERNIAHVIWHVCCPGSLLTVDPSIISAHAFTIADDWSKGSSWFMSMDAPYSLNVTWVNGTQSKLQRRERPQLLFDDKARIRVLFTGVVPREESDASFTMAAVTTVTG